MLQINYGENIQFTHVAHGYLKLGSVRPPHMTVSFKKINVSKKVSFSISFLWKKIILKTAMCFCIVNCKYIEAKIGLGSGAMSRDNEMK